MISLHVSHDLGRDCRTTWNWWPKEDWGMMGGGAWSTWGGGREGGREGGEGREGRGGRGGIIV